MATTFSKITVMFDEPFWIAVFEREHCEKYEVCKITFGAEPKDYEVYDYFLKNYSRLCFGESVSSVKEEKHINPKRIQRAINKQLQNKGIGTKAQQALKLLQEEWKLQKKTVSREKREEEKELRFRLRQEKRKEKHRGH